MLKYTYASSALELPNGDDSAAALVLPGNTISYGELRERVRARRDELGGGRRLVMVSCTNSLEPIVTYLAALSAGHPVLLVADDRHDEGQARNRQGLIDRYDPDVVLVADDGGWPVQHRRKGSAHTLHPELAVLLSTSGSSGSPKMVRLSRDNILSNARSIADYLDLVSDDRGATTLPMHYCYGLSVLNSHLFAGASLLLTERSVADEQFWHEFAAAEATSFAGVPYTFDLLETTGFSERSLPTLRCITQAGGRLGPERVRGYARLGRERGFDFFVMYGQTEATARMAYLPPGLAETRPECIGVPIPGGHFRIDEVGPDAVGQLVYTGPNVMMGYAEGPADLAAGSVTSELRTGDLARQHENGLYEIVGRSSRFVKVFGLRIDLDRVERILAAEGFDARAVDVDERLVIFTRDEQSASAIAAIASERLGLPVHSIRIYPIDSFPLTSSGKSDAARLRRIGSDRESEVAELPPGATAAEGIRSTFALILNKPHAGLDDSFVGLQGDSLDYVEVSLRIEQLLGTLPRNWPSLTARELAAGQEPVVLTGSRRVFAAVEMPLVLRAAAIVLVTATHANLLFLQGGAHLLLGILGFNLARFQFAAKPRRARISGLVRSAVSVFVPAVLWIGAVGLITGMYLPTTSLLVNGLVVGGDSWSTQWQYWFLEAAVWAMLGLALLFSLPQLDRLERRWPFLFSLGLVGGALAIRLAVSGGIEAGSPERYTLPVVLWLIALGWLIARSTDLRRRFLTSLVVVLAVPGFFGDLPREAVIIAGLLLLLWFPSVPLPRFLVPAFGVLAAASFFIYLVQWQVYPHLEDHFPLLATLASFAVGIAVWQGYLAVTRQAARATTRLRALGNARRVKMVR